MVYEDEIKTQIVALDATIASEERRLEQKKSTLGALEAYIDNLYARRMRLEAALEREEAQLVKPEPQRHDCGGWSI